jgi:hypothetical protein
MAKNKIDINLETLENDKIKDFIQAEIAHCKKHRIAVHLIKQKQLLDDVECSGFFTDEPQPLLRVNASDDLQEWFPIFIHETCHKDQFLEKSDEWTAKIQKDYDSELIFDMWVARAIELKKHQFGPVLQQIIDIELDCEKRAVYKIKEYDLPLDVEEYIQKANAYIFYYHAVAHQRRYSQRRAPYANPNVWKKMPVDFDCDYATIKTEMLNIFLEHCY